MGSIKNLIKELESLPSDWCVSNTVHVFAPKWARYGYIFADGRPTKLMINHTREPGYYEKKRRAIERRWDRIREIRKMNEAKRRSGLIP